MLGPGKALDSFSGLTFFCIMAQKSDADDTEPQRTIIPRGSPRCLVALLPAAPTRINGFGTP